MKFFKFLAVLMLLLLAVALSGCSIAPREGTTYYVCPDGTHVKDEKECGSYGVASTATSTTATSTETSSDSTLYGVDGSLWTKQGDNGWVLNSTSPEKVTIADGYRVDYTASNGDVYSCGDADAEGPGVYGPKTVDTDGHATVWEVPGESACPSWTQYAKAHSSASTDTSSTANTAPAVTPTTAPATTDTGSTTTVVDSSWTPAQKCEWLKANFPQDTSAVQALGAKLAGVVPQRVRTHLYPCDAVNTVFDGLIILGPNEGYSGTFTIQVPGHGAVDSYLTASYSGEHHQIGSDTIRATTGSVTATTVTYWPWNDDDPPTGSSASTGSNTNTASTTNQTSATQSDQFVCKLGQDLASQMGWKLTQQMSQQDPSITKYGGVRVTLTQSAQLPAGWEALSSGRSIKADATDRTMVQGDWSIYPPNDGQCRQSLGVQG